MDKMHPFSPFYAPTPKRPLLGMTILAVEDSRFAGDGLRLMCLHSGARIRRADSISAAHRHLRVYRPTAAIIDLGLPDGSGLDLIRELSQQRPRIAVLLGLSGDEMGHIQALRAGADGFLAKPLRNLAAFQEGILRHMPRGMIPTGPRMLNDLVIEGDPVAYEDDLAHVVNLIDDCHEDPGHLDYIIQFLDSLSRAAGDRPLAEAARQLSGARRQGGGMSGVLSEVRARIRARAAALAAGETAGEVTGG